MSAAELPERRLPAARDECEPDHDSIELMPKGLGMRERMKGGAWVAGVIGTLVIVGTTVATQNQTAPAQPAQSQPAQSQAAGGAKSVGRGWPLAADPRNFQAVGPGGGGFGGFPGGVQGGGAPAGAPAGGARGAAPGAAGAAALEIPPIIKLARSARKLADAKRVPLSVGTNVIQGCFWG